MARASRRTAVVAVSLCVLFALRSGVQPAHPQAVRKPLPCGEACALLGLQTDLRWAEDGQNATLATVARLQHMRRTQRGLRSVPAFAYRFSALLRSCEEQAQRFEEKLHELQRAARELVNSTVDHSTVVLAARAGCRFPAVPSYEDSGWADYDFCASNAAHTAAPNAH
eukprot:7121670-Prymnesium_polylepis.1